MRLKLAVVAVCAFGVLWPSLAAAQADPTTTTTVPISDPAPTPEPPPIETPAPPATDPAALANYVAWLRSLMPAPPPNPDVGRRIVYSISGQRIWFIEADGSLTTTYLVSGRAGMPQVGIHHVFSKSRFAGSGSVSMQYMVRFAHGRTKAIGFHSIPVRGNGRPLQTEAELGKYRSHGCVRQRLADAAFLWDWTQVGTTVVVVP